MRMVLLICLVLSCGKPQVIIEPRKVADAIENDPRGSLSIDTDFLQIVDKFETIWGRETKTPIWYSSNIPVNILALCHTFIRNDGLELTEIVVQPKGFHPDSIEAEIILFHELGHCELKRDHEKALAKASDGRFVAYSIMFPTIISSQDYQIFHNHYLLELFGRGSELTKVQEQE